jgi:NADPH2:quinone reductase
MRKIEVKEFGGPEVMKIIEVDKPLPSVDEVLIKVEAVGVNPVETYIRAGTYPRLPQLPYTPGGNVSGIVDAVGSNIKQFKKGDRVYSGATKSGAYAEYALCAENQIYNLPSNITFEQGAALGVPAATAWRALFIRGEAVDGERVFIHGGSGSVGQAAVQFCVGKGLEVHATAGTAKGCKLITDLGAVSYNHRDINYVKALKSVSGGFNLILEMLANINLETDLELLAPSGRVVIVGSRGRVEIDPRATMGKETDIRGFALFNATKTELLTTHNEIYQALLSGEFVPSIAKKMKLEEAGQAHKLVMEEGNCGKIILLT